MKFCRSKERRFLISVDLVFPADPQQENVWAKVINIAHWCIVWWNEDFMPFDLPTSLTFDQKISGDLQLQMKKEKKKLYPTNGTRRSMCHIENTLRIYLICIIWPDFWCKSTFCSVSVLPTKGAFLVLHRVGRRTYHSRFFCKKKVGDDISTTTCYRIPFYVDVFVNVWLQRIGISYFRFSPPTPHSKFPISGQH